MKSLNNYLKKNILIRGTIKLWHNHLQKSIKKKKNQQHLGFSNSTGYTVRTPTPRTSLHGLENQVSSFFSVFPFFVIPWTSSCINSTRDSQPVLDAVAYTRYRHTISESIPSLWTRHQTRLMTESNCAELWHN